MLIKSTTYDTPEIVKIVARNTAATTAVPGDSCQWDVSANTKGVDVFTADAKGECYAGIWTDTVAQSKHGLIQIYGYSDTIKMGLSSAALASQMKLLNNKSYVVPIILGVSAPGQSADYDQGEAFITSWTVTSLADSLGDTGPFNGFIHAM